VVEQCYSKDRGRLFVNPIIDWTDQDVWDYINNPANNIPAPPLYGEPYTLNGETMKRKDGSIITRTRVGCIMCPMQDAQKMKADAERWPKIAAAYRRSCQKALDRRLIDGKGRIPIELVQWKTGDELYDWWISGWPEDNSKVDRSKGTTAMDIDALLDAEVEEDEPDGYPPEQVNSGGVMGLGSSMEDGVDD